MSTDKQPRRSLGHSTRDLPEVGLGCMGMSEFYGASDEADSLKTLHHALDIGINHLDTADMYGSGHNERLIARLLAERRDEVFLATKFAVLRGANQSFLGISGKPEYVHQACDASLERLGIETIDLYYQHRPDPQVPIEETIGAMAQLVEQGKVRYLGVSECSAEELRRAHSVHPISAYQGEYSLWTRIHEGNVLEVCKELGITYVAYSPLGRGFLTGAIKNPAVELGANDFRRKSSRFTGKNLDANLAIVELVNEVAAQKGCTTAQLALAWVLARGEFIVTIPGTRRIHRLEENAAATRVVLSLEEVAHLAEIIPEASGPRYG